jgi:hypothetical protein
MVNTYTKGGSTDIWAFAGNMTVAGTQQVSGAQTQLTTFTITPATDVTSLVLGKASATRALGIDVGVATGTLTTGIGFTGTVTTGINFAPTAATTAISIGLTGKTYTTGVALGVSGGTLTTGLATAGTVTTGISLGATTANHIVFSVVGTGTDGNLIKGGTSGVGALSCGTTADTSFVKLYTRSAALSGDARGIYNRLYLSGAGGSGESFRTYTTVDNVAAATAHGTHTSLSFATSGSITGLGVAGRFTLEPAAGKMTAGTYAAIQAEIYHAASADMSGVTKLSVIRAINDGDATAMNITDDYANLFELSGFDSATGNMVYTGAAPGTLAGSIRINIDGTPYYMALYSAQTA